MSVQSALSLLVQSSSAQEPIGANPPVPEVARRAGPYVRSQTVVCVHSLWVGTAGSQSHPTTGRHPVLLGKEARHRRAPRGLSGALP